MIQYYILTRTIFLEILLLALIFVLVSAEFTCEYILVIIFILLAPTHFQRISNLKICSSREMIPFLETFLERNFSLK